MKRIYSIMLIFAGMFLFFTNSCEKQEVYEIPDVILTYQNISDQEGNVYKTIQIGTQVWMAENLRSTKYRDGTDIPFVDNDILWDNSIAGAYCNYENDDQLLNSYGRLYNWYAVQDRRGLAPTGWHIPTESEWETLANFLGGENITGSKIKEKGISHWNIPNSDASNESGFTALPCGARGEMGQYCFIGTIGYWWSADLTGNRTAYLRGATNNSTKIFRYAYNKKYGFSVRCIKD